MNHKNPQPCLYEALKKYAGGDFYPFHMPGHKRQLFAGAEGFFNPYQMDLTEIEGFDNLHHAEGILRESMDWAASVYGADHTYYLINGSSCGILSAISAAVNPSGSILMSRNCHKSAYHGVFLNRLKSRYVYPQYMRGYGIQCGLSPSRIETMLKRFGDISAVFVVSPTYDGIVSDIESIAGICHMYGVPFIVDEAHGAHFRYSDMFPVSALDLGADVVIQSVHKTLPCFTQSAILHIKETYVDREKLERFLQIYQSSSPSYVLMAGIEQGIRWMEDGGRDKMREFSEELLNLRKELENMRTLELLGKEIVGTRDIYDFDLSKIIVSTRNAEINGFQLCGKMREEYHLEMEMCTENYVTAIASVMDAKEGFQRLRECLMHIDGSLKGTEKKNQSSQNEIFCQEEPEQVLTIYEAWESEKEMVLLEESEGRIGTEFICLYPPGIPMVVPGERITAKIVDMVLRYRDMGLSVQGMRDKNNRMMEVIRDGQAGCN